MVLAALGLGQAVLAAPPDGQEEFLRRQAQERARQEQQSTPPDVRLETPVKDDQELLPQDEAPCFKIERVILEGERNADFQWALAAVLEDGDTPLGRCLGTAGIHVVMKRLQNAIIRRGYVTTRVLARGQDLTTGELRLTLVPGVIRRIRLAADADGRANLWNALPAGPGDLLNLRDIEQALENLKRVPTVEADIEILPAEGEGSQPGESDLVIGWRQGFPLRLTLTADDSGGKATGKRQGGIIVSGDHLLTLNDLIYLALNRDLEGQRGSRGTRGHTLHYTLPFGYWQLALNASAYRYHQSVAGASQTYRYSGESRTADIRLSRIVWRDAVSKTAVGVRGWVRDSKNFIDDTEILVQRRRMAGWEISLNYRRYIGQATLDATLAHKRGTGALKSLPAPEEPFGEGTSRPRITTFDGQFNLPFALLGQRLRYNLAWRAQWSQTPLVPQDRFPLGGRYTIRGFDGENVLSAERGWLARNELGWALENTGQEAYLGIDVGEVSGPSAKFLVGKKLAGAVLGLRGSYKAVSYDFFVGKPLEKPAYFATALASLGFNLVLSF